MVDLPLKEKISRLGQLLGSWAPFDWDIRNSGEEKKNAVLIRIMIHRTTKYSSGCCTHAGRDKRSPSDLKPVEKKKIRNVLEEGLESNLKRKSTGELEIDRERYPTEDKDVGEVVVKKERSGRIQVPVVSYMPVFFDSVLVAVSARAAIAIERWCLWGSIGLYLGTGDLCRRPGLYLTKRRFQMFQISHTFIWTLCVGSAPKFLPKSSYNNGHVY
ncbi:hypothetical protein C8R43DRAFT_945839 [Mycena crocata]|nr:hypothetical protein C8R43DRAFT_945839 [Mycena crocata]